MHPTIYLETSVIRHLTDPPSDNPITHACQQLDAAMRGTPVAIRKIHLFPLMYLRT